MADNVICLVMAAVSCHPPESTGIITNLQIIKIKFQCRRRLLWKVDSTAFPSSSKTYYFEAPLPNSPRISQAGVGNPTAAIVFSSPYISAIHERVKRVIPLPGSHNVVNWALLTMNT